MGGPPGAPSFPAKLALLMYSLMSLPSASIRGFALIGGGWLAKLKAKLELDEVRASDGLVVMKEEESSE